MVKTPIKQIQTPVFQRLKQHFARTEVSISGFDSDNNSKDMERDPEDEDMEEDYDSNRDQATPSRIPERFSPCRKRENWPFLRCLVCSKRKATVCFFPCGHGISCNFCANEVIKSTGKCFMCSRDVEV